MEIKKNMVFKTKKGNGIINDILGEGGQGTVYSCTVGNKKYALKVYKEKVSDDFIDNLTNNVESGSPSESFIWPLEVIKLDSNTVGYLMDLRPNNYSSFISYLNGAVRFKDTKTLIHWCIELCSSFKKLHEKGFSYQDLNDGSFFLNQNTGDLLICDNDNVTADKENLGILGKMRYMAPEIVKNKSMPDIHSDRFSLGVILFMAFCMGNPYEGERLKNYPIVDEKAEREMFGTNPIFVYHKTNKSNRPIRGYHTCVIKRWQTLPLYLKEAFHRTFVDGISDRENGRTTEIEWLRLLSKYRDEMISCKCGNDFFGTKDDKIINVCPYCGASLGIRKMLTVNRQSLILEPGKKMYSTFIDLYSSSYNKPIGEVIRSKSNPNIWGIKLNLDHEIQIKDSYGGIKDINESGVIPIVNNLKIKFSDNIIGKIN